EPTRACRSPRLRRGEQPAGADRPLPRAAVAGARRAGGREPGGDRRAGACGAGR
ncbi:MAG: Phosphoribosylglycinamide formyltransferase, partial [uncultured Sphingomonadaceae bacterium]